MQQELLSSPWAILALAGAGVVLLAAIVFILTTAVYKHIICLKYLFSGWKAVVPVVSALPAALGVFLLILVFSIMDGFASETREMTRGTLSDVIVDAHMEGMPYYDEFIRRIEQIDGVEAATPIILTPAIARIQPHREEYPSIEVLVKPVVRTCQLIGIRPDEKAEMGRFTQYLQEQKDGHTQSATLLTVPAKYQKAGVPPRPGCIAGSALIGAPKPETQTESVLEGVGRRVLAGLATIAAFVVFLVLRRAARRRPGRPGWRVAVYTTAALTAVLLAVVFLIPVRTVEVERTQIVDWPLIDYGDNLEVATIPIRPQGILETDLSGLPRVNSKKFALVDAFKSGYYEADSSHVYVDFKVAQQMAGMEGQPATADRPAVAARASQVQVKIKDPAQGRAICQELREVWGQLARERPDIGLMHLSFNTWEDQQRMILTVVEVEKNVTVLMLGLMFLGFGILIGLISYVMAYIKSRDVGILKAVGARDAGVGSLFLGYGFIIGLVGMTVGMVSALLVIQNLDAIEIWVNATLNINIFPREMYYFEHIPRTLSALWCVGVGASVLVLSTLASLAGGLLAALRQPVETLRYE